MTRILVDPHQLRSLSVQLQRVSGELRGVEGQLAGALGGLTWEARQKATLDTKASHARGQARELATEVEKMSRYLERKAQVFDEADGRGVPRLLQLSRARIDAMRATAPWLRFPSRRVSALAGLGAVLGGSSLVGALHLPALTGIAVSLAALTALSAGFLEKVQGFLERIWRGSANSFAESESLLTGTTRLGELLDPDPAEEAGPHVDSQSERKTRLGELLDRTEESEPETGSGSESRSRLGELLAEEVGTDESTEPETSPPSKPEAAATPGIETHDAAAGASWGWDVRAESQEGLKHEGDVTNYGCTPTATSMILDYWHTQDPKNKTMSAQDLLNRNVTQGEYELVGGMSPTNILDDIAELGGYETDQLANATADDLREAVSRGPVLAVVKSQVKSNPRSSTLGPTGENHAVVVTGISEDGRKVRINDPWTGKPATYSWTDFSSAWGADFGRNKQGDDFPSNNLVTIHPSGEQP